MTSVMTGRRARGIGHKLGFVYKVTDELAGGIERKAGQSSPREDRNQGNFGETGTETSGQSFQGTIVRLIKLQTFSVSVKRLVPGTDSVTG